jgi:hypothetical protein
MFIGEWIDKHPYKFGAIVGFAVYYGVDLIYYLGSV